MFPSSFLEILRSRICLLDLVQSHQIALAPKGHYSMGLCPFHKEKTPSFCVYKDHFHCFGCGARGDSIEFLRQHANLSFEEAVKMLAEQTGLELPDQSHSFSVLPADYNVEYSLLKETCAWFMRQISPLAQAYLAKRGISKEQQQLFQLGWSDQRFLEHALAQGYSLEMLKKTGLARIDANGRPFCFFYDRLMFPIFDQKNKVIGFGGRTLKEAMPKYLNSPHTNFFHKSKALYSPPTVMGPKAKVLIVEGYFDVIRSYSQSVFPYAPLGTALTEEHLKILWKKTRTVYVAMDGDEAGKRAQWKIATLALKSLQPECMMFFLSLPSGYDPDSYIKTYGYPAFLDLMKNALPLSAYLWQTLFSTATFPEDKAKAQNTWDGLIQTLSNPILKAYFKDYGKKQNYKKKDLSKSKTSLTPKKLGKEFYQNILFGMLIMNYDLLNEVRESLSNLSLEEESPWIALRNQLLLCYNEKDFKNVFAKDSNISSSSILHHIPPSKDDHYQYWMDLCNDYETYMHKTHEINDLKKDLFSDPEIWNRLRTLTHI